MLGTEAKEMGCAVGELVIRSVETLTTLEAKEPGTQRTTVSEV